MPKILYKFPSRERPEKFFAALDNIRDLSTTHDYFVLATLDVDDPTMITKEIKERIESYGNVAAMWGTSNNKVHACNRDMEFFGYWDIVVLMSDDIKFLVKGFDQIIIDEMAKRFPDFDGVLHFPDSHGRHELIVLSIMGRKYYERDGYLYKPEYATMFCDNEFTAVARIRNKYVFVPQIIFDHFHHIWGMSEKDALNVRNDNQNLYINDNQTYLRRNKDYFGLNLF